MYALEHLLESSGLNRDLFCLKRKSYTKQLRTLLRAEVYIFIVSSNLDCGENV